MLQKSISRKISEGKVTRTITCVMKDVPYYIWHKDSIDLKAKWKKKFKDGLCNLVSQKALYFVNSSIGQLSNSPLKNS